ncbi:hypothetical protein PYCCODRAFT_1451092 [Trametes coccinea BRFM310]|uniref:FIST domain-containing protein n=1 Tax=Trametes coccinea (strain BRFM310) TaxID=1353009 RepID=A0A1Y2IU88_TRAC3|nr:hypothetical protein PYCCODRAFT_1451092 [Trametes coccinea BRFM310]
MASHMSTIISRKPAEIVAHLSKMRATSSSNPLLYTISASPFTDSSELLNLVSSVKTLSSNSVGCLSAAIPSARTAWQQYSAVSLAVFDVKHATLFRSTIPGRKAALVGRWHAMHKDGRPEPEVPLDQRSRMDWESALSNAYDGGALPLPLEGLSPNAVDSIVYFTDNAPEGLSSSLAKFSSATKLGLIGTSTPFVTGRPYTLFHNESIHSEGAVGICLSPAAKSSPQSAFPGLEPLTRPMVVTSSEGNLVNALDNANPSGLLLRAIQNHPSVGPSSQRGISPDLRVYMGTLKQYNGEHELNQLFYVMSGDPSRGSIALDTDAAPEEGALVQMFLLPPSASPDIVGEVQKRRSAQDTPRTQSITFAATLLEDAHYISEPSESEEEGPVVLEDVFLAASENGCIVSRSMQGKSERPWKCSVPGGMVGLQWAS